MSVDVPPSGWETVRLGDLGKEIKGSIRPEAGKRYELYSVPAFSERRPEMVDGQSIGSNKRTVEPGDVLLCKINPRINRVWSVGDKADGAEQIASTEYLVLRLPEDTRSHLGPWLKWYLRSPAFRSWIELNVEGATGSHTRAKSPVILEQTVPLAPPDEQRRIVQAIETHLSHLDAGLESLERATTKVDRMRAALLKAASLGELVPQDADEEPASELLRRVLDERRTVWEEKGPTKRYKEPVQPEESGPLPEGWTWASVSQLSYAIEYGTSTKASTDPGAGVPVLRMGNLIDGILDYSDLKYIPHSDPDIDRYLLDEGDVLFNRTNSAELVGKTAVFEGFDTPIAFASYLIRVKPLGVLPSYLAAYINGPQGRRYIASVRSQQVGQANVNGTKLGAMPVALPPVSEQRRIVEEVERQMSVLAAMDTSLDQTRRRSNGLRRAVLAKAFSGELIDQMAFA